MSGVSVNTKQIAADIATNAADITTNAADITTNAAKMIGDGQTVQDLTVSRALDVTYTNTTGRPIMVFIICGASGSVSALEPLVDGQQFSAPKSAGNASVKAAATIIVPDGSTYRANAKTGALNRWVELR